MANATGLQSEQLSPLEKESVERAIQIGRYCIAHARVAFGVMGTSPRIAAAKFLLRWIQNNNLKQFSQRDAHQGTKGRFRTAEEVIPVLNLLQENNYIRKLAVRRIEEKRSGRPSSPIWEVNPIVYKFPQRSH